MKGGRFIWPMQGCDTEGSVSQGLPGLPSCPDTDLLPGSWLVWCKALLRLCSASVSSGTSCRSSSRSRDTRMFSSSILSGVPRRRFACQGSVTGEKRRLSVRVGEVLVKRGAQSNGTTEELTEAAQD